MHGLNLSVVVCLLFSKHSNSKRIGFGNGHGNEFGNGHGNELGNGHGNGNIDVNNEVEDLGDRIIGGEWAEPGEFPFFVQWRGCGASLIHGDILLTAAHCEAIGSNDVLVGAYIKWTEEGDPVNSVERKVVERRVHPLYDSKSLKYDFMVLKLDKEVDLPPVLLYTGREALGKGQNVTVMGFGSTQPRIEVTYEDADIYNISIRNPFQAMEESEYFDFEEGFSPRGTEILQKVVVNHVDTETCNDIFDNFIDEKSMLCAGTTEGGKDACYGDSGGPLVWESNDGTIIQVGVVSFGEGCARAEKPGVYSLISGAYGWIQDQICDMSSNSPPACLDTPSPTLQPSLSASPSLPPTNIPSPRPTPIPPSALPSLVPSYGPSAYPSKTVSSEPTGEPSRMPSSDPSMQPSISSSESSSTEPSATPTMKPSPVSSIDRTVGLSPQTSAEPSASKSRLPSFSSSLAQSPMLEPTEVPSLTPTKIPSPRPTKKPTVPPTMQPSSAPSTGTSPQPTVAESQSPSSTSSVEPTAATGVPSAEPSASKSRLPSISSSLAQSPMLEPTEVPSSMPTKIPSPRPTKKPTVPPTMQPSSAPSTGTSPQPTVAESQSPSSTSSVEPSAATGVPSLTPTKIPSPRPTKKPTVPPTMQPSSAPSTGTSPQPTVAKSQSPSSTPSLEPTASTGVPSSMPTKIPSPRPTKKPTDPRTLQPSSAPSTDESAQPSGERFPTSKPTVFDIEDHIDSLVEESENLVEEDFEAAIDGLLDENFENDLQEPTPAPTGDLVNRTEFLQSDAPSYVPSQAPINRSP